MELSVARKPSTDSSLILLIATVASLSFLFFTGFPFYHHNESYLWAVLLDKISFSQALTQRLEPVQSIRPLGTATAWLTYRLSSGIALQQLFNWVCACLAFILLFRASDNKRLFSAASFIAVAGFFAGYIYLFHLHGVFYGPLQLYIAYLAVVAIRHRQLSHVLLLRLAIASLIASLYHTFAALVFAGFLAGYVLQVPRAEWRQRLPVLIAGILLSLGGMYLLLRHASRTAEDDVVQGALVSYSTTELNLPLHLLALLLAAVTAYTIPAQPRAKWLALLTSVVLSLLMIVAGQPVLLVWIAACLLKLLLRKAWAMASLVGCTAIFPVATHTGTPTYVVFVIMLCLFVTCIDNPLFLKPKLPVKWFWGTVLIIMALTLVVVKSGRKLPGMSAAVAPLLAEREKTFQLKQILEWKKGSTALQAQSLHFADESQKPSASKNAVNRKFRPPTQQRYLNRYSAAYLNASADTTAPLLITFGGKKLLGKQLLFEVTGIWNGAAAVYR